MCIMRVTHRHIRAFDTHLARIQEGWSEDRVLLHAGRPDHRSGDRWIYTYTEPGLGCLQYSYFEVSLRNGNVRHVRRGGGHKIVV